MFYKYFKILLLKIYIICTLLSCFKLNMCRFLHYLQNFNDCPGFIVQDVAEFSLNSFVLRRYFHIRNCFVIAGNSRYILEETRVIEFSRKFQMKLMNVESCGKIAESARKLLGSRANFWDRLKLSFPARRPASRFRSISDSFA